MAALDGQNLLAEAQAQLSATTDAVALDQLKSAYLGKKGHIGQLLRQIGSMQPSERKAAGEKINGVRIEFEKMLEDKREHLRQQKLSASLNADTIDLTLQGRGGKLGALHPISLVIERTERIFASMGFAVAEGPEIEDDYHNFGALNHPDDHPARSMHDTFYLTDGRLLRTHTSPVQVRYMEQHKPPLRIISPGRCYRVDNDATHSPMFHQVEGLWVDETIRFSDLKGVLLAFFQEFFEDPSIEVRFRPSFFPFTEPSAECDIKMQGKWLEVAGCGMVHPNVLASVGIESPKFQGWAFGTGLDRLAMLRYGCNDLRTFFENDLHFLAQFA